MKLQSTYRIIKTKRTCNYDENVNNTIDVQEPRAQMFRASLAKRVR